MYYTYKNEYDKEIDSLSAKKEKKASLQTIKLNDDYRYKSDEEQGEQEEQNKQDKKQFDIEENIEWMINKEDTHVNKEIFKKYFQLESPSLMYKVLRGTNDKGKKIN